MKVSVIGAGAVGSMLGGLIKYHSPSTDVLFVMRGGSLKELQEILGHKDISMTMRYAHLTQGQKKKAINLMNGLTTGKNDKRNCHILPHLADSN